MIYRRRRKWLGARYRQISTPTLPPLADNVFRFTLILWTSTLHICSAAKTHKPKARGPPGHKTMRAAPCACTDRGDDFQLKVARSTGQRPLGNAHKSPARTIMIVAACRSILPSRLSGETAREARDILSGAAKSREGFCSRIVNCLVEAIAGGNQSHSRSATA
jgi:hypothetical protein